MANSWGQLMGFSTPKNTEQIIEVFNKTVRELEAHREAQLKTAEEYVQAISALQDTHREVVRDAEKAADIAQKLRGIFG
jgi:ABC-type transporter Mla subunit MlaD